MKNIRIIPRMDIKGPNLVKGIHLEGLRVLGKPEQFARHYYEQGADELLYIDIVASLYNRNSLLPIVERTAKELFIPLTVGGGLRSIDDMRQILRAGADKVALNTAVVKNPHLITEASRTFGSSTIVVSIEAIKQSNGQYYAYTDNGREYTGIDVFEWAIRCAELGAGEILLTSVDQEGTGHGFDVELTRKVSESVSIPVIACGGAGSPEDVYNVIADGKADAVSIASILHYDCIAKHCHSGDYSDEGNIEYLKSDKKFLKIRPSSIGDIKDFCIKQNLHCRCTEHQGVCNV
ncbi:MAG: imidazole glycerol phosphate synthase subunit HisF [Elusimicrobia bacterium]|nr:imidazole glycerol phosphate synthase subunit HisF [Elusimicrobiota bacterium]MBD3412715.1 imidazole glycerol phosphate synthase subunit HisF [Elusimicrobiota bacterium]